MDYAPKGPSSSSGRVKNFLLTASVAHLTSYPMGTGGFPRGGGGSKAAWA
jgi:hypothetical protein